MNDTSSGRRHDPPPPSLDPGYAAESGLADIIGMLVANRWLIACTTLVGILVGALYGFLSTRVYSADALLQIEQQKSGGGLSMLESFSNMLEGKTPTLAEIEIIRSRYVLGRVIDHLNLDIVVTPRYFPVIGGKIAGHYPARLSSSVPGILRAYAWGGESISVSSFEVPQTFLGEEFVLRALGDGRYELLDHRGGVLGSGVAGQPFEGNAAGKDVRLFLSELEARPGTEFTLVKRSPVAALKMVAGRLKVAERGRQSGILSMTYEDTNRGRAARVVNEIAENYVRQNIERRSAEAQQTLDFLEKQMPDQKQKVEAAEQAVNDYLVRRGSVDMSKETESVLGVSVSLESQLLALRQKRQELTPLFTPQHPTLKTIDGQIQALQKEVARQNEKIKELPETQQEVLRLQRDVQVSTGLYVSLLNTAQELRLAREGTVGNVRIVDRANVPESPIRPQVGLALLLTAFLGAFAGIAIAALKRTLHQGIENPDLIERNIGLPLYAVLPESRKQNQMARKAGELASIGLLANLEPQEPTVEALRSLRTSVQFAASATGRSVLMITGPRPSVGKSFISTNLAAVLAQAGKKVIVVDADMRRGQVHRYFGGKRAPGLSEILARQVKLEAVIQTNVSPGVDLMATGELPPNPAELLIGPRTPALFAVLREHYEWIIVDTPPVLAVTDAAVIGQHADVTLLVARSGVQTLREINHACQRLLQAGVAVKGIVFNGVKPRGAYSYGYEYGYEKK
jgi:tyrosine-protein kinase Etk/Wzc